MIKKNKKRELIAKFQKEALDTGSPQVQISIFTARILEIADHLSKKNKKDYSALRGLQKLVSKRKKLLAYLLKKDPNSYASLIKELGIRG
ncbi:MAG: 30S ribosomal protein S15 [Candidatus Caenarcaniphilales bacterium]|nr:30S ribosomal protein S15 [Candidatus Caenarcaniphilales bacterium]